ncbi:MAG: nitronate monooxygenase [Candidatus Tectomicrobia bacterium]|uniref:Nitronate monooxygenase n=1 Tax=Tectimicrobiota bacterium TaxID=2528274 RepID=A0A933GN98_UNCTE|nr:nitronate monooxygenase [Candidatus Tectomicrobia bacterium]
MKKTRLCDLLSIEYPIIQGAMRFISMSEMVAAVSMAGGLGTLAGSSALKDMLAQEIFKVRQITDKPFTVNISLRRKNAPEIVDLVIEQKIPVVITSAGDPSRFIKVLKDNGIRVLHVVPSVRLAKKAEEAGVDAVIAEGTESGGHVGFDEITTMVLIPQVVEQVKIPVIAAGGFADGRGLVAALSLGAEGIQMGTRFLATTEAIVHDNYKKAIIEAQDNDTTVIGRSGAPLRVLKTPFVQQLLEMEKKGSSMAEIEAFMETQSAPATSPDVVKGMMSAGQVAGLIREVKSIGRVIRDIMAEADAVLEKLSALKG